MKPKLKKLLYAAARNEGCRTAQLRGRERTARVVNARVLFTALAMKSGFRGYEIGWELCRTPGTVSYYCDKAQERSLTDGEFLPRLCEIIKSVSHG